ncbi:MAG: roadblock/LC7 domain-containing protein [Acinetobacter harbinensis]|uniref:roadblock/LC7 domain-containing protein n=1 Tax=Acinetobacter sp. TaxID=472 RepID=UPI002579499D|nr:roadblock/LC7 domain-containing protein [Acinetobacter sp.]MBR5558105.1 roadblock/LC7 domain-containing protein [Acinetobacter sp.]MDD2940943.1 roadblock/LC7 domain-containing protein [Acinetobacter harbinensis]
MFALNNQRQISAEFKEQASQQIHELLNMVSGVDFVMLSSADGFELALASKKNLDNRGKIAAVSSSILAMVSAFIAEIHLSGCKTITLDADNGKVILTAVDHPQYPLVLIAVASKEVLIGQLLYAIKKTAETLAQD